MLLWKKTWKPHTASKIEIRSTLDTTAQKTLRFSGKALVLCFCFSMCVRKLCLVLRLELFTRKSGDCKILRESEKLFKPLELCPKEVSLMAGFLPLNTPLPSYSGRHSPLPLRGVWLWAPECSWNKSPLAVCIKTVSHEWFGVSPLLSQNVGESSCCGSVNITC